MSHVTRRAQLALASLEASLRSFFATWNEKKENKSVKDMAAQYVESEEELCLLLQRDFHGTDHTFAVKREGV